MARQLAAGYLGLQTHGGTDRISYREIQVKEFAPSEIPVNTVAPTVSGTGFQGQPLTCNHGTWNAAASINPLRTRGIARTRSRWGTRASAPRASSTTQQHHAGRSDGEYGNQDLTWLDSR